MDLKTFLDKIVFGWIKNDLERMTEKIPSKSNEIGNINFPLALCTLAYMEYLGGFLLGEDKKFSRNVEEYTKKCFEMPDEYPIELLRDMFRNGLSHEYFARGGISRAGLRPALFKQKEVGAVLDIETLVRDFLVSLSKFKNNLNEEKYNNRMANTYSAIQRCQKKLKSIIDELPEGPTSRPTGSKFNAFRADDFRIQ